MNEEEYLKNRLDDQIDWYDRKSTQNQNAFKRLQVILIVAAASIPFISGYVDDLKYLQYLVGGIGVLVAAITGILSLRREIHNTSIELRHKDSA